MMGRKGLVGGFQHALIWYLNLERWGWNTDDSRVDMPLLLAATYSYHLSATVSILLRTGKKPLG